MKTGNLIVIAMLILSCSSDNKKGNDYFKILVKNELKFANLSKSTGRKTAFLANLHDSAMVLSPAPVLGRTVYENVPDIPGQLIWLPEYVLISSGGDLGFTTGPWKFSPDSGKTYSSFGHYISIWQNRNSIWKIIFDGGNSYKKEYTFPEITERYFDKKNNFPIGKGNENAELIHEEFLKQRKTESDSNVFIKYGNEKLRIYRNSRIPFRFGNENKLLTGTENVVSHEKIRQSKSTSGDLYFSLDIISKVDSLFQDTSRYSSLNIWVNSPVGWRLLINLEIEIIK